MKITFLITRGCNTSMEKQDVAQIEMMYYAVHTCIIKMCNSDDL